MCHFISDRARMRTRRAALAIVALGAFLVPGRPARAAERGVTELMRVAAFLDGMAKLNYWEARADENTAYGTILPHDGVECRTTFSMYDCGIGGIPDDINAPAVREAFAQACRDLESGVASGTHLKAVLRDSSEVVVRLPWHDVRFLVATHLVGEAPAAADSVRKTLCHTFFTVMNGQFVRARYAHAVDETSDAEELEALEDFTQTLAISHLEGYWAGEEEARRAEPEIRAMVQWLYEKPCYPPDEMRRQATTCVRRWIMRMPHLQILQVSRCRPLDLAYEECDCGRFVADAYLIGCAMHRLDSATSSPTTTRIAGLEFALEVYAGLVATGDGRTDCPGLLPLVLAREAGTLGELVGE